MYNLVAGVDERRGALNQWGTYYKKLWSEGLLIFKGCLIQLLASNSQSIWACSENSTQACTY